MTKKFVDCFMIMGTALSLRGQKLPEMGRPILQDISTTFVNFSLTLRELRVVNFENLEIELVGLMNQKWIDPRLGANKNTRRLAVAGQIWRPKIVNINGESKNSNADDTVFWRGFGDEGHVLYSEKVRVKAPCTWDYRKFPFDIQVCEFKFGSFRFPQEEVAIVWDKNAVEVTANLNLNDFKVSNITTYTEVDIRCTGNFSSVVIQFVIKRHSGRYIQCIMLPPLFLTLLNYVTLWFKLNNRARRLNINMFIFGFLIVSYYISVCLVFPSYFLKASDVFVLIYMICAEEETRFHLKKSACHREYPRRVYWLEFAMKLSYPVFYIFFLILYGLVYF